MNIIKMDNNFRSIVNAYIRILWNGPMIVTRSCLYDTSDLPGYIAEEDGVFLGAVLYRQVEGEYEVAVIFSLVQGIGVGSKLLDAVVETAKTQQAQRVWLVTTNDNIHAIRFFQKYSFTLKAVHINALNDSRKLKNIPEHGYDNIPIMHEFEFEILLK